ncbi:hypothetical protein [Symbiobacterium thermophilum]|uniref:Uncharacterized protein n=1 Tax=Symbiobacterium thermophilum TaxID=2734 RepID=A0A953LIM0_SYMTR|nr:hypothetical protein [Symbiobacterium thermophilum]MBY6274867.1 hypothetical protein [Symbiobacterium thermophilum]
MSRKGHGKRRSSAVWAVSAAAVALVAVLIGASVWSARSGRAPAGEAVRDADLGAVGNAIGPADAPVTVVEYMDYA